MIVLNHRDKSCQMWFTILVQVMITPGDALIYINIDCKTQLVIPIQFILKLGQ